MSDIQQTQQELLPTDEQIANMTEDEVMLLTRKLRLKTIRDLHKNGALSGENSDRNLFVSMVNGLDSQAINNKKIATDQKTNSNNAALIAEIVSKITPANFGANSGVVVDVSTKVLPDGVIDIELVPGETDVAPPQMDYNSFVAANARQIPSDLPEEN